MDTTAAALISNIIRTIEQRKLTLNSAIGTISLLMEHINEVKIPGEFKADVVINVLKLIVGDRKADFQPLLSPKVFSDIQLLLDNNLVQQTIDVIYDASTGKFNIGQVESCIISWLSCMKG